MSSNKRATQSTPRQHYTPPAQPATTVRTVTIPASIITVIALGCMFLAIVGALFGAFK